MMGDGNTLAVANGTFASGTLCATGATGLVRQQSCEQGRTGFLGPDCEACPSVTTCFEQQEWPAGERCSAGSASRQMPENIAQGAIGNATSAAQTRVINDRTQLISEFYAGVPVPSKFYVGLPIGFGPASEENRGTKS
jgi:hypothetical protein